MSKGKKGSSRQVVINLASHKMPEFKEVLGKDYILFGEKNEYPQHLLDLYFKCSKHNAIVNGKAKYISGAGWTNSGDVPVNTDGETLNAFTNKVTLDCEIHNGEAIEVIWKAGGKYAEFRHVDWAKVRSNADNTEFYYTKSWFNEAGYPRQYPNQNQDWTVYEPFDVNKRVGKQLIYYKYYTPGLDVYPLPEYKAALLYIELEYQISNYWYNRVKNGFMPSAILNFYMGNPTDDEMKKVEERIKAKFSGTNNSGQFILNFAPNKDSAADIQQINPPELGQEYEALNKTLQTEIFTGHGVTNGMLFGIKEPGQLGGRGELIEANELFQNRYVSPKQLNRELFFGEYIFPYIKGIKGKMTLKKQEPIGYMFSEGIISKFLPAPAITKMIASKMGVDLKQYPEYAGPDAENGSHKFIAQEDKVLAQFKKRAKKRNGKVLKTRPVTYEMSQNLQASEEEMRLEFKDERGIVGSPTKPIDVGAPGRVTERISIVYRYDWIPGFSDANISTSREFCVDLLEMSKAGERWTREDIESISTDGYEDSWGAVKDVWGMRGGWRTKPGTDIRIPSCRHQWVQEVILETF